MININISFIMSEDLFEDTNLKVYENQELIYQKLKENTIEKMNILGNRIEKILELNENALCNEEATLLLFQSVKSMYQELLLLKEDVNLLKEASIYKE
jgi:hypothetical protein